MRTDVHFIDVGVQNKIDAFIGDQLAKLERYFNRINSCDVFLKKDYYKNSTNHFAEIKLRIPGRILFATGKGKNFQEAVDLACSAMKKQLIKYKTSLKQHVEIEFDSDTSGITGYFY